MGKLTNRERQCKKKKSYLLRDFAIADIVKYEHCNKIKLYVYKCDICGKYHLTHRDINND
jgi:hypothetical protein